MYRVRYGSFLLLGFVATSAISAEEAASQKAERERQPVAVELTEAEQDFQQTMSGAVLVGHFTKTGQKPNEALTDERYTIRKVAKLPGKQDVWRFFVRIQYGDLDVTLPLDLHVHLVDR